MAFFKTFGMQKDDTQTLSKVGHCAPCRGGRALYKQRHRQRSPSLGPEDSMSGDHGTEEDPRRGTWLQLTNASTSP